MSIMPTAIAAEIFTGTVQPVIPTGDGLILRAWESCDAPAVFEAFSDPAIQRWHRRSATSIDEVGEWIDTWKGQWRSGVRAQWAVTDVHTGDLVGRITLSAMVLAIGQAEVTYWTMPTARGRGVAPRAVVALTAWADEIGFHRLELTHSVHNQPSCRVAAKTGFALEGTKRSAAFHSDGWHDMHLHARINN